MKNNFGPNENEKPGVAQPEPEKSGAVHTSVRFEPKEIRVSLVLGTLAGLVIMVLVCAAIVWGLYVHWTDQEYGGENVAALMRNYTRQMFPPAPRLEGTPGQSTAPQEEMRRVKEQWERKLNSYGWVNRQAGIARIPITEAMKLLAERHLGPKTEPHPQEVPDLSASR